MDEYSRFKNDFIKAFEIFEIKLDEKKIEKFYLFYKMLIKANETMNLTSIVEMNEVINKHFIDSLLIIKTNKICNNKNIKILDLGTGAGFPGIPLAIIFDEIKFTLVDSLNKRINFINNVCEELDILNVETIHSRAEDLANNYNYREKYNFVISRAVAKLSILSEFCLPFVSINSYFCSYKTDNIEEEINDSKKCINLLGGKIEKVIDLDLNYDNIKRKIVFIKKINTTSKKFPRKAGIINKKPIE